MIFVESTHPPDLNLQQFVSKLIIAGTTMSTWNMAARPSTFVEYSLIGQSTNRIVQTNFEYFRPK